MAEKSKLLSKISNIKILKNKHIRLAVIIILVCIAVLLALSSFTKKKTTNNTANKNQSLQTVDSSALNYANQVSKTLEGIINNIKGISNAKVVVVVSESPKMEYLTEDEGDKKVIVYDKQGSSYKPVAVVEFLPKITGILIVAKGTNDLSLKNNLLNAISAVYNVDISCIDILEGK